MYLSLAIQEIVSKATCESNKDTNKQTNKQTKGSFLLKLHRHTIAPSRKAILKAPLTFQPIRNKYFLHQPIVLSNPRSRDLI